MADATSMREYSVALRRLGFRRDPNWRHTRDPILYVKVVGNRSFDVQLWRDGAHRVSHALGDGKHRWRETTHPTEFHDLPGMFRAIAFEATRTDGKGPEEACNE